MCLTKNRKRWPPKPSVWVRVLQDLPYKIMWGKMNYIQKLIKAETTRQNNGIELIASENYPSSDVRKAMGSILTCKYAEGYPNKRYYGGCKYIDEIENYAIKMACKLFKCKYANVQAHSGSQANAAAYRALEVTLQKEGKLKEKEKMKILSMDLNSGGHLTHGSPVSFSSHLYNISFYPLGKDGRLDFDLIEKAIIKNKPHVILAGYSAYPYKIDFAKFKELADKYDLKFMVDMAHIAGLVAADEHMSPIPYADIVTTTTHKTLRGPRGGLILTNNADLIKRINSAVFPYYQGGPLEHVIAAKAICFEEASKKEFKEYIKQVIKNTRSFSDIMISFSKKKYDSIDICLQSENHLTLLNTKKEFGLTGLEAQKKLDEIGITTNKNMLPNDDEMPNITSGLRIGFAALTTRGCNDEHVFEIAHIIHDYLSGQMSKRVAIKRVNLITKELKSINEL